MRNDVQKYYDEIVYISAIFKNDVNNLARALRDNTNESDLLLFESLFKIKNDPVGSYIIYDASVAYTSNL